MPDPQSFVVDGPDTIEALTDDKADEGERAWVLKAAAHIFVLTREQDYHDRYTRPDKLAEDPDWDRVSSVFSQRRRKQDEVVRWNRWAS